MIFELQVLIFPLLGSDVPRLPPYGIYLSHLVHFAKCCTISVLDFRYKHI